MQICGAIVLGVGIWFLVDENALKFIHVATVDMNSDLMRGASITMIVVSALAFIVGFFGCCGACKENTCMLQSVSCYRGTEGGRILFLDIFECIFSFGLTVCFLKNINVM